MSAREVWTADAVRALGVRTDVVTAGSVLGIGRGRAYELARAGEFPVPVLKVGATYIVPVRGLLELLGVGPADMSEGGAPTPPLPTTSTPDHDHGGHRDRAQHAEDDTTAGAGLRAV